jgi:uncharacterized protein (TIGR02996 family)
MGFAKVALSGGAAPMNDQQKILAAVLAEPEEDLHRFVYADCCEDLGNGARAEFIRVQLESHRAVCRHARESDSPAVERLVEVVCCGDLRCRRCRLEWRARELLGAGGGIPNGAPWLQEVDWPLTWDEGEEVALVRPGLAEGGSDRGALPAEPVQGRAPRWSWDRGFVGAVSCSLREWLMNGPILARLQPLTRVHLRDRVCRARPLSHPTVWSWTCSNPARFPSVFHWCLPRAIFAALPGRPNYPAGLPATAGLPWKEYASPREARAALSQALLGWARGPAPWDRLFPLAAGGA